MINSTVSVSICAALLAAVATPQERQRTTRVSVDSAGLQGNEDSCCGELSANGRYVVFHSTADNLVAGDTNDADDIFLHDRASRVTTLVSVDSAGVQGNASTPEATISADGRFVAFFSHASNLVPGDTNGLADAFVRDLSTGITERVSVDSFGQEANASSYSVDVSGDGRFVVFASYATNLVPGDTNGSSDVFVRDRVLGTTKRVSVKSNGSQVNKGAGQASISDDGLTVVFESTAANLVSGDTNGLNDVFVHDVEAGTTERVSVDSSGAQANAGSAFAAISATGRFVVFASLASNLVAGDTNADWDVFVHDRSLGTTTRASVGSGGTQANGYSNRGMISADGRFVAFKSWADNLISGDTNGTLDVFVHDRRLSITRRVSVASDGTQANGFSSYPVISADGRHAAFYSEASNLVPGDTNQSWDVLVTSFRRARDG